jgi:heme-degrading monooxygenase HmoA
VYAHVNIWRLNEAGESTSTAAAHTIANRLREQPGFRSYAFVRTGPREVVVVTIFETQSQLEDAIATIADIARQRILPLASGEPERRKGEVAYYLSADDE